MRVLKPANEKNKLVVNIIKYWISDNNRTNRTLNLPPGIRGFRKGAKTAMRKYNVASSLCTSLFFLFILLFSTSTLKASTASVDEMNLVAENWLTKMVVQKSQWVDFNNPVIEKVEDFKANDTLLARVYSISPEGYIIVPVLKELPAVKVYSDEGTFEVDADEGFPAMIREVLLNRVRNFIGRYGSLDYSPAANGEAGFTEEYREWSQLVVDRDSFKRSGANGRVQTSPVRWCLQEG